MSIKSRLPSAPNFTKLAQEFRSNLPSTADVKSAAHQVKGSLQSLPSRANAAMNNAARAPRQLAEMIGRQFNNVRPSGSQGAQGHYQMPQQQTQMPQMPQQAQRPHPSQQAPMPGLPSDWTRRPMGPQAQDPREAFKAFLGTPPPGPQPQQQQQAHQHASQQHQQPPQQQWQQPQHQQAPQQQWQRPQQPPQQQWQRPQQPPQQHWQQAPQQQSQQSQQWQQRHQWQQPQQAPQQAAQRPQQQSPRPMGAQPAPSRPQVSPEQVAARLLNPAGGDPKALLGFPPEVFDPGANKHFMKTALATQNFTELRKGADGVKNEIPERVAMAKTAFTAVAKRQGLPPDVVAAGLKQIDAAGQQAQAHLNGVNQQLDKAARDHLMSVLKMPKPGPGEPDVTDAQIRSAHRRAMLRDHPDKAGGEEGAVAAATEKMKVLNQAWGNHDQRVNGPGR